MDMGTIARKITGGTKAASKLKGSPLREAVKRQTQVQRAPNQA